MLSKFLIWLIFAIRFNAINSEEYGETNDEKANIYIRALLSKLFDGNTENDHDKDIDAKYSVDLERQYERKDAPQFNSEHSSFELANISGEQIELRDFVQTDASLIVPVCIRGFSLDSTGNSICNRDSSGNKRPANEASIYLFSPIFTLYKYIYRILITLFYLIFYSTRFR
jgi:hypothetical protein